MTPIRTGAGLSMAIHQRRLALAMTQAQLGEQVGISQKRVSQIETCASKLDVRTLFSIVTALGLELTVVERHEQSLSHADYLAWLEE
jgi:transcriptional regulator with XRE-family HTH domain